MLKAAHFNTVLKFSIKTFLYKAGTLLNGTQPKSLPVLGAGPFHHVFRGHATWQNLLEG